jgi:hypothetical protein
MKDINLKEIDINKPRQKKEKKKKILTDNDIMKYEIAGELGLLDKVSELGWGGLTAKEAGKIGGVLTSRKKQKKKIMEAQNKQDGSI